MIDRGDLAAEIGLGNLYEGVNRIAKCCKSFGKPLIMATENLCTMMTSDQPNKSDIISLGHSTEVGTDIIMLSEETAVSSHWQNIMTWLQDFLGNSEFDTFKPDFGNLPTENNLMWATISKLSKDYAFVVSSRTGKALHRILSMNFQNIHLITDSPKTLKLASLYRNNLTLHFNSKVTDETPANLVYDYVKKNKDDIFRKKSLALSTFVSKPFKGALADNITFISKENIK